MKSLNAVLCYYHPSANRAVLKTKLHWATEWGTTKQRFHFYESQAFDDNLIATYQAGTLPLAEPDRRRRRPALRPGGHGGEAGHDVRLHHRRPQRVGGYERARRGVRPRGQTRRRVRGPWKPPAAAARATQQPCAGRPVRPLHAAPGAAVQHDAVLGVRPAAACAILAAHHALRQTVRRAPSAAPWPPHRRYVAPRSGPPRRSELNKA